MWVFGFAEPEGRPIRKLAKYTGHDMMVQHAPLRNGVNNNIDGPKQNLRPTATEATYVHEVRRQGPISTSQAISPGPGPVSILTSTTTTTTTTTTSDLDTTTMPPSPTTTPSSTVTPTDSPTSSNSPSSVTPTSHSSDGTSSATPSSSSSSSPSPSPTSPSLDLTVQNMTTCTSALISWDYSGKEAELFLSITNLGVSVDDVVASPRIKARQGPAIVIENQLADTNTSAESWTWSSVNVTQGWYEIAALALTSPTIRSNSAPFFVSNGTDTTCLTGTSLSGSSPSSSHSTHTASIVGGVVGAIVGVALVVFAGLYWRSRRRRKVFGGVGFRRRKWDSLKSATSSIQRDGGGSASQRTSGNYPDHTGSTGAILQDVPGGKVSATTTPGASDEDVVIMGEEKLISPTSPAGMNPFEVLNTPVHYDRRTSLYSDQTPPAVANEASRSRSASLRISAQSLNQNLEQQAQRIRNSMETTARRRSDRLSMPSIPSPSLTRFPHSPTLNQPQEEYQLSPVTPMPVNRSISNGTATMATRRTARKPVPHLDPSLLLENTRADSVSTFTGGGESSQSHGTGMAAGANGTPPDLDGFGDGRPVHYLIPDMPPPQHD